MVTLSPSLRYRPIQCVLWLSLISILIHLPVIVFLCGGKTVPRCDHSLTSELDPPPSWALSDPD